MHVMLDTNILVSAFIFKSTKMHDLINILLKNHKIVICSYTIEELYQLVRTKFKVDVHELDSFLRSFNYDLVYSPTKIENKIFDIRDKNDYIILYTAILEDVDIFITGDKDFEDVNIEKPEILSVSKFLQKYC